MSLTPSNMMPLGTMAPDFKLWDTVTDQSTDLKSLRGKKGSLVMFICNHCPFVVHVNPMLRDMGITYQKKGIAFIAISSNDIDTYPQDAPKLMKEKAKSIGYTFPYLFDETQAVAKAYDAACTPDFYLFDESLKLIYRGQLDDSRPGNGIPLSGRDLSEAIDALLAGREINQLQRPSIGCNIKWKR